MIFLEIVLWINIFKSFKHKDKQNHETNNKLQNSRHILYQIFKKGFKYLYFNKSDYIENLSSFTYNYILPNYVVPWILAFYCLVKLSRNLFFKILRSQIFYEIKCDRKDHWSSHKVIFCLKIYFFSNIFFVLNLILLNSNISKCHFLWNAYERSLN